MVSELKEKDIISMDSNLEDKAIIINIVNKSDEKKEKNAVEAQEGGWGYVVLLGTVISFIAGIGHINSLGLIYNDFIIETKSAAKSLTTAHGVFGMMLAIGGIILNILSKKFSLRLGGLIGAIVFTSGSFSTIFLTDINQLTVTFGVLQGIGFGIIAPVCYSVMNQYFVKKRTTMMSATKTIQGIVLMWYPQLIKELLINYGLRGTLLVISAISLHTLPGMVIMKSVVSRPRKPKAANHLENEKNRAHENINLLLSNKDGQICEGDKIIEIETNQKNKSRFQLKELLTIKVLKDPVFLNICFGQSFVNYSDLCFFVLQPMLMFQYGYDRSQVATCISIGAGADVVGRCMLTVISSLTSINTRLLYYCSTLLTMIIRLGMLQVRQFFWMTIVTASLGVLRAWLHIASPLVISNHVTHQDFPGAYSMFMLSCGVVNVMIAPLVGLLKDVYQDYTPTFYVLCGLCLPCLICWPLEYVFSKKVT